MEKEEPITSTDVEGKMFQTEVNMGRDPDLEEEEEEDEDDYQDQNVVRDPEFNFEEPYSRLPKNVPIDRVKTNVCTSMGFKPGSKFAKLFDSLHITAIISDSFWYIICIVFKPGQFIQHEELFLDRIAANYVSFTLQDEFMGESEQSSKKGKRTSNNFYKKLNQKDSFFNNFYNAIAQSIFCCLYFAYPKSRSKLNDDMKRNLLDTFSELFTGTQIKSASFEHWNIEVTPSNMLTGMGKDKKKDEYGYGGNRPLSLADVKQSKNSSKTKRDMVHMKYSPLVERYLKAHKYETMNNVQEWKMLLTQRTGVQKEIDEKFAKYQIIAQQAVDEKNQLDQEYNDFCAEVASKKAAHENEAKRHIEMLKRKSKELLENGCSEYANMLVSLFNYEYAGNMDDYLS